MSRLEVCTACVLVCRLAARPLKWGRWVVRLFGGSGEGAQWSVFVTYKAFMVAAMSGYSIHLVS
jgi:hypothetical protein